MPNKNLTGAQQRKDDDYYTKSQDILDFIIKHKNIFKGKTIVCPCDDVTGSVVYEGIINGNTNAEKISGCHRSNFAYHFATYYKELELTGIICSCFSPSGKGIKAIFNNKYTGSELEEHWCDCWDIENLEGNGDYRSEEVLQLCRGENKIVVTNPPFSISYSGRSLKKNPPMPRIYNENGIDYILIAPTKVYGYIWFIEDFKTKKIFSGDVIKEFLRPNGTIGKVSAMWISNIKDIACELHGTIKPFSIYDSSNYQKPYNCDAIFVNKSNIPCNYTGIMFVGADSFGDFGTELFEIVGHSNKLGTEVTGLTKHSKDDIKNNDSQTDLLVEISKEEANNRNLDGNEYYTKDGIYLKKPFANVGIRWKTEMMPKAIEQPDGSIVYRY